MAPRYRDDASGIPGAPPLAVLAPRSAQDCAQILSTLQRTRHPCVVQGGRTGLSGGARVRPQEIVLSLERLTQAPEIDPVAGVMIVGAGVALESARQAAAAQGLFLAADLGARGSATLGGMAATNAGGPLALRYGTFRQQVLGLEGVLADGTIICRLDGLAKDNSGYDLGQFLIGTEGTLGVITRLALRLHPAPRGRRVAICALDSADAALTLLPLLRTGLGALLTACELIVEPLMTAACTSQNLRYPFQAHCGAAVLIEVAGPDPDADGARLESVLAGALETGLLRDAVLSASEADCKRLWALREGCSHHLLDLPAITSLDLSLPIPAIPSFLSDAAMLLVDQTAPFVFGHMGDGNLHYILPGKPDTQVLVRLFKLLARHGGVITAEHGVGLDKVAYLPLCRPDAELAAMARLKAAVDPHWILNPGRVLPDPLPAGPPPDP
ncbi:FAD-binding oxidoreductase [Paracoccus sp. DMF-8]|uniref:FAD-binding oxidoreductase n=1 Tax=Paracoccus sp. DMF-8 TaxID=3019445 RepID=UPI0023E45534|nr:FAD-binding oxidoreductase [Paracoccus sp. DMF-8]MDF3607712.1 FAD-binding oxidoreductase [Paracoccus sp. DMF-8]